MLSRRPPALALVVLAALGCAAGLTIAPRGRTPAVPWRAIEVNARRAPSFELIPISRRDDAVLRSQPQIQVLGAGTTLARAKLARLQGGRIRRLATATGRARHGGDTDRCSGRPPGTAAPRLRAPPSPA
jgi:hypothetical protein